MTKSKSTNKKRKQQDPVNPEIAEGTCPFCGSDNIAWGKSRSR